MGSGSQNSGSRRPRVRPSRARGLRTSTGCLTCRKRRIKCDEGKPTCVQCGKSQRECLYAEEGAPDSNSNSRARLPPRLPPPEPEQGSSRSRSRVTRAFDALTSVPPCRSEQQAANDATPLGNELRSPRPNGLRHEQQCPPHRVETILPPESSTDSGEPAHKEASSVAGAGGLGSSISPLPPDQLPMLQISPFEWYDLLAQDAISTIQRLNDPSNGGPRWNFDESTLSRRQSPAPDGLQGRGYSDPHAAGRFPLYPSLRYDPGPLPGLSHSARPESVSVSVSVSKPWNTDYNIELSSVDLKYFAYYIDVVGPILDLFDPARHFTNVVPHLAIRNTGLLKSILAVAAQHMSLGTSQATCQMDPVFSLATQTSSSSSSSSPSTVEQDTTRQPPHMATQYYYETLQYLSQTLLHPSYADSHEILATAIMISTYEMLGDGGSSSPETVHAGNSHDWERHLRGAFWILRSQDNDGETADGLRRAAWWAWVRQDIWSAFRAGRPTLTIWRPRKPLGELDADELSTRIIYIAAKCMEFVAADGETGEVVQSRMELGDRLLGALQEWHDVLPPSFSPLNGPTRVARGQSASTPAGASSFSGEDLTSNNHNPTARGGAATGLGETTSATRRQNLFPPIWIHPPRHAAAMQMYHFARAVVLLNQPTLGGLHAYRQRQKRVNESLHVICGIANACREDDAAMAFINVQAVFAAGQCVQMPEKQAGLQRILERMLRVSKFPARGLVPELASMWHEESVA